MKLTITLMLVVISDSGRPRADTIPIRPHAVPIERVFPCSADDAIIRRGTRARLAKRRTRAAIRSITEAPIRADGPGGRDGLRGKALGTVIGVLCESLLASDTLTVSICALVATELANCGETKTEYSLRKARHEGQSSRTLTVPI